MRNETMIFPTFFFHICLRDNRVVFMDNFVLDVPNRVRESAYLTPARWPRETVLSTLPYHDPKLCSTSSPCPLEYAYSLGTPQKLKRGEEGRGGGQHMNRHCNISPQGFRNAFYFISSTFLIVCVSSST